MAGAGPIISIQGDDGMNCSMISVADKIKSLRQTHGLTQEDLAAKAGCGIATIQRAESGARVSANSVASIAAAFNISAASLAESPTENFEPYLPLAAITGRSSLVDLLRNRQRLDFSFSELNDLQEAKAVQVFHDFCLETIEITDLSSPIALVTRELEARNQLEALEAIGLQVGGAEFEIHAYEIDDEGGMDIPICFGEWDEPCVAIKVGRTADDVAKAFVLRGLGKWETVKNDAVVYPPSAANDGEWPEIGDEMSRSKEEG